MAAKQPERAGVPQGAELSPVERRSKLAHDLGIGELTRFEVVSRFADFRTQLNIGLNRDGAPTRADGGLLAFKLGIPPITAEAWNRVSTGATAYVADIAGTNWNVKKATKKEDGTVDLEETSHKKYDKHQRQVTFDEFVSRIVSPIAGDIINEGKTGEPVDIGIALGFPHENQVTPNGIDAHLSEVKNDGDWTKFWKITDWDPEKHTNLTAAIREKFTELGITVRTLVAINDTPAVALDGGAVQEAEAEGLEVIKAGFVGGTGTNGAVNKKGLVNTEIGRASIQPDAVFEKMKENGWITESYNKWEFYTGESLAWRLAAGMQLMHENDETFTFDAQLFDALKPKDPDAPEGTPVDDTLIDRVASGEYETAPEIQELAASVMKRAGQEYGAALAALSEAEAEGISSESARAFMVEGSVLLKGYSIKQTAEETAEYLRQPVVIKKATGLKGVGSLAMTFASFENLREATREENIALRDQVQALVTAKGNPLRGHEPHTWSGFTVSDISPDAIPALAMNDLRFTDQPIAIDLMANEATGEIQIAFRQYLDSADGSETYVDQVLYDITGNGTGNRLIEPGIVMPGPNIHNIQANPDHPFSEVDSLDLREVHQLGQLVATLKD